MDNLNNAYNWYKSISNVEIRIKQLDKLIPKIKNELKFDKIICIETGASQNIDDGCIGLFFAKLCELTNGEFHSVDNQKDIVSKSKKLYLSHNLKTKHYIQDSVKFLKETSIIPNLIHLDSWDLNLTNPLPSALHGWREFTAIENKMPIGSIIIIDDNFFKGTWVNWNYDDGELESKHIDIEYPIIGKGSLIYHFVEGGESNWKKLSIDKAGFNEKIIFKKIK
tara:strand:- start:84 stop:752 length:669 start_codon:yes stop_codon:yes gene_type:complete